MDKQNGGGGDPSRGPSPARGVRSTDGNAIRGQLFKRTLTSPTISGQRVPDGKLFPGNWTPIVSPEESRQLGLLLNRRPNQPRQASARKYLLTGLIRCGRCEQRMQAHARNGSTRAYICQKQPGYTNCGSMSVSRVLKKRGIGGPGAESRPWGRGRGRC